MAKSTSQVLCRYYMNGFCSKGPQCTFSHDHKDQPDMVCRYYLHGSCTYDKQCRYDHSRPKNKIREGETREDEKRAKKTGPSIGPVLLPSLSAKTNSQSEEPQTKLVTLKKDPSMNPKSWVMAAEFVPGREFHGVENEKTVDSETEPPAPPFLSSSYSSAASAGLEPYFLDIITPEEAASLMCPFAEMGVCPFGESCEYQHGDMCELCNKECLSPFDPEQRKSHHRECLLTHEQDMERAFAVQRSEGKTCGVCMEVVLCKVSLSDRRFGILSDCNHCFCLACIRKWRGSTHSEKKTIRACPLCRVVSYFVVPSEVWVEEEEEKETLVSSYKSNMGTKHCKHFERGKGTCPFGNSCFYKHEYPDGEPATVQPRVAVDHKGDGRYLGAHTLWQFIEERDERHVEQNWTGPLERNEDTDYSNSDYDTD